MGESHPCFTVVSYNVCGVNNPTRVAELSMFLSSRKPSVLVLQEPKLDHRQIVKRKGKWIPHTPTPVPRFHEYQHYHFTHPTEPTGIIMYVHASCMAQPLATPHHCTPYRSHDTRTVCAFMWISSPSLAGPIVLGGIYMHHELIQDDVHALAECVSQAQRPAWLAVSCPSLPIFLVGDFNARHVDWDPSVLDSVTPPVTGRWIHKHLLSGDARELHPNMPRLTLLNTCYTRSRHIATHTSPDGDTVIDLALASHPSLVSCMDVLTGDVIASDHFPTMLTLCPPSAIPVPSPPLVVSPPDIEHKYDDMHDDEQDAVCTPDLIVRVSTLPNSGHGLFARRAYNIGDAIVEYTGELLTRQQYMARYPCNDATYVVQAKRDMYIDARDPDLSSLARYINSAGEGNNNATLSVSHRHARSTAMVRATHAIQAGDEIFFAYGATYKQKGHARAPVRAYQPLSAAAAAHVARDDPPLTPTSGRVKWKINHTDDHTDWSVLQTHITDALPAWQRKYSKWAGGGMHARHAPCNAGSARVPVPLGARHLHASLYSDGASRGNPGPASCGGVIYLSKHKPDPSSPPSAPPIHSYGMCIGNVTNNEAEYRGLLAGLRAARTHGITHITAHVDSLLVCKQLQGMYAVCNSTLTRLHAECKIHIAAFHSFRIVHVLRGMNAEADAMCNHALDTNTVTDTIVAVPDGENGLSPVQLQVFQEQQQELLRQQQAQVSAWEDDEKEQGEVAMLRVTQAQIDVCWQELHDMIISTAQTTIGTITATPNSKEWWSRVPNMRALHDAYRRARQRRRAVRRARAPPSISVLVSTQAAYVKAKAEFLQAVRTARSESWYELAAACDNTTEQNKHKLMWSRVKRTMPSLRVPPAAFANAAGEPPHTPVQALSNMAAHLAHVSSHAPDPSHDADHERHVKEFLSTDVPPYASPSEQPSWTLDDVIGVCSRFRLNTALGSDNVSPYFLRYGGNALHRALFTLFSICWRHGVVPSTFRHGHVVTLYKGEGEVNDPNSYRPICITSVVARVYERLQVDGVLRAMARVSMPSPSQFGFTRQRSTHDAIYRLLSHIVETIGDGTGDEAFASTVFVDISKAYDKVWIDGLLYKLQKMGITGNLYYMLRALLTDRTIQVVSDGKISDVYVMRAGVPQGSILAPFLFLIYIHDICNLPSDLMYPVIMSLFADDIALLTLQRGTLGMSSLQRALSCMSQYARKWKLTFSAKKTNVVFFRTREEGKGERYVPVPHVLTLTGFTLDTARMYKYLGVTLDDRLTLIPHMHDVLKRVSRTAHLISRLVRRDHLPSMPVIQTLVKCVLIPQMTYGFPFLSFLYGKAVSTRQATDTATTCNFPMRFKNCIMQPLLHVLGLPHNTHHASVLVESRLHDVRSLHALTTARLAHRWLSLSDTNNTAHTFRSHLARYGMGDACAAPPKHPFARMCAAVHDTPLCFIGSAQPAFFLMPKTALRSVAWGHQFGMWEADGRSKGVRVSVPSDSFHSLRVNFKGKAPDSKLPMYMHLDEPATASHRARFRLGRVRLLSQMHRLNFADVPDPLCLNCTQRVPETSEHVLLECSKYNDERDTCSDALRAVLGRRAACFSDWSDFPYIVMDPQSWVPRQHLARAIEVTGKFIDQVVAARKC